MSPDMKTWWGAVPDRSLVAARRKDRRDTFYAYRYGDNGRWLWFDGEWDFGQMCWSWEGVDDATDGVIIARDVSPAVSRGVVAELCGLDCDRDHGSCAVTFGRRDRILWDDIQPGMAVMVEGAHVVYRLPSGNGLWVRHACETWWGIGAGHGWHWRSHEVHGAGNSGVCAVMATGVEPTDDAIRAAVGGLSVVMPLEKPVTT